MKLENFFIWSEIKNKLPISHQEGITKFGDEVVIEKVMVSDLNKRS